MKLGGLTYHVAGAEPGNVRLAVILCHGYASSSDDLLPIAKAAFKAHPVLEETVRFYFPAGVVNLGDPVRGWWPVDETREALAKKEYASIRDLVHLGSSGARRAFSPFVDAVLADAQVGLPRLVIGGFSQGGMLALDTALRLPETIAGVIVMSSMVMCESRWRDLTVSRSGMPVVITHGTKDPLIDPSEADHLASVLSAGGLEVDRHSFDGSHTVDVSSASVIADWLKKRAA